MIRHRCFPPCGPSRLLPALLVLLSLLGAGTAQGQEGDFLDTYRAGVESAEAGDWAAVEQRMREAIAGRPDAAPRLPGRFYFKRYIPHYYLGKALFEQGDCAGALAAWNESERQGVVQRTDEHALLLEGREACERRSRDREALTGSLSETEEALRRAEELTREVSELSRTQELKNVWAQGSPSLAGRFSDARTTLDEARSAREKARSDGDPSAARAAAATAGQAVRELTAVREAAEARLRQLLEERAGLVDELSPLLTQARSLLSSTRYLAPYPREIGRLRGRLESLLASAQALSSGGAASPDQVEALRGGIAGAVRELERAAAPPPDILVRAVEAYLGGLPQKVVDLLTDEALPRGRARAHAHLLRAAAHHQIYRRTGEAEHLEAARAEVRACREADASLIPPESVFSPAFRLFFESQALPDPPP